MSASASFLEHLIDACVMEWEERMKYEGRMMKWSHFSGALSFFIIQPSSLSAAPEASEVEVDTQVATLYSTAPKS